MTRTTAMAFSTARTLPCKAGGVLRDLLLAQLLAAGSLVFGPAAVAGDTATYVFVCDDETTYTVRATGAEAWLFGPGATLRLPAASTDGAKRYADGRLEILIEGEAARIGETGRALQHCRNDRRQAVWERAKLDGADFRAVGNEPGWHLEILEQSRIVLVADYGASRVETPLPAPATDPEHHLTRWDAGELVLEVIDRRCTDTMSGELFPAGVVVHWQSRTLRGCGRPLH